MQLTTDQLAAVYAFDARLAQGGGEFVIAGLAGTGKTTIIKDLLTRIPHEYTAAVCTPTGKAAFVLRSKDVEACTVHSLLYYPKMHGAKVEFIDNDQYLPDVVIVDEASMLDDRIVSDLRARVMFVCYVGDHGQLEPIGDDPGLMKYPDVKLEKIHRQAEGSAIIRFAHRVRNGKPPITCGPEAQVVSKAPKGMHEYDAILCAFNKTRVGLNAWVRRKRQGIRLPNQAPKLPVPGEQVICLRNSKHYRVFNGMTGVVRDVNEKYSQITVDTDDGPRFHLPFVPEQFGMSTTLNRKDLLRKTAPTLWDFGYALTAHKAQGSEYKRVAVFDEVPTSSAKWDPARWRYTVATRASEQLTWVTK